MNGSPGDVGRLLAGRWRLMAPIGSGSQGHTYLARDEKSPGVGERLVVVKALRLGEAGWKKFDLFEREARTLSRLEHPGIPRYIDRVDGEGGAFYIVMERAPGETLRALAARRRFADGELRQLLERVLDILIYLGDRDPPVVHRDIKPANLLLAVDGAVSLVDFGGVRAAALGEDDGSTVIGTYGYMAPEQLHGEATPRTDLYGLGATIVSLAGGVEPDKVPRRGLKMDLERHLPRMAKGMRALLDRMVDPDPDRRPASAAETRKALAGLEVAPVALQAVAVPSTPPAVAGAATAAPTEDDWVAELDELRVPPPIRFVFRVFFGMLGIAGHLSLALISMIFVPLVFGVARGFSGKERDARLNAAEERVQGALRDARKGFRVLQERAFRRRPRPLRAPREPRRLPRRRDR